MMARGIPTCVLSIAVLTLHQGIVGQRVIDISPYPTVTLTENDSATMNCTYSQDGICPTQALFEWWLNSQETLIVVWTNNNCTYGVGDKTLGFNCSSSLDMCMPSLTLKQVQNAQHGDKWKCLIAGIFSKETFIFVNVPITSVALTNPTEPQVTVIENMPSTFVCETSPGRPQATIQWYKQLEAETSNVLPGGIISSVKNGTMVMTRSTLHYSPPSRDDHGYSIFCKAYNINVSYTVTSFNRPKLHVQFSPRTPVFRFDTSDGPEITSTFHMVRGDSFSIYCSFSSDPESSYQWSGQSSNNSKLTVTEVQTDSSWTCTATNDMLSSQGDRKTGSATADVSVDLFYAPSKPTFIYHVDSISSVPVDSSLDIINGRSVSVTCNGSESKPAASFMWNEHNGQVMSDNGTLLVENVDEDQSSFMCVAHNEMNRTYGTQETGRNSATLTLNILRAPTVHPLTDETLVENQQPVSKTCDVTHGNPQHTMFRWTRGQDSKVFDGQVLLLSQVDRSDAGLYTCMAWNVMSPTGEPDIKGESNATFTLKVLNKAEIASFTIFGRPGGGPHTFDELSTFTFHCVVDSYPGSHVTISKDGQSLESGNDVTELGLAINQATCSDAGLYTCVGYNEFNGVDRPFRDIQVFVRCKPRPLDLENNATFYKALHEDVILSLKVIAYPNPSEFRWSKQNNDSTWTVLTSGVAISDLQSSLAIVDLQESDYGQYRITVVNSIGTLVHYFVITKPVKGSAATQNPGVYIGAGVGAFAAVVAIIVITVIVIKRRRLPTNGRTRRAQRSDKESSPPNRKRNEGHVQEYISMDDSQERRATAEKHVYEELTTRTKGTEAYDVLSSESGLTDVGTAVGVEEQYENLSM